MNIKIRSMLAIVLLMVSFQVNAQDPRCFDCPEGGSTTTSTFTNPLGTFNVTYIDCGGQVRITNITVNGASTAGSLLYTNALLFFFQNNPGVNEIIMPASCWKWHNTWNIPNANLEGWFVGGLRPTLTLVACAETGCCIFNRSGAGLLEQLGINAPMCGQDCFEVCQGQ